jgi:hypothetical protein
MVEDVGLVEEGGKLRWQRNVRHRSCVQKLKHTK